MSPSPDSLTRTLIVHAAAPSAEIFVLDRTGRVLAKGVESITAEKLPIGIHKVRIRIGQRVMDTLVELPPGEGPHTAYVKDLPLESPVPEAGSADANALAQAGATSRQITLKYGSNPKEQCGRVFLFCGAFATSISVRMQTFDGTEITGLEGSATVSEYCSCNVELDPGSYLLRAERKEGDAVQTVEQTLYVAKGWQTQVFLAGIPEDSDGMFDLSESAILMAPMSVGFDGNSYNIRRAEAARQALAARRSFGAPTGALTQAVQTAKDMEQSMAGLDKAAVDELLRAKFDNPMLGIYGAHLVLLQANPNRALLREVTGNLRRLLGSHPDVEVVSLFLGESDPNLAAARFPVPPMLRSSWSLLVQHSSRPGVVPAGSYTSKIGGCLWGSGACLAWRPLVQAAPATLSTSALGEESTSAEPSWRELVQLVNRTQEKEPLSNLTPAQQALVAYCRQMLARQTFAHSISKELDDQKLYSRILPVVRWLRPADIVKNTQAELDHGGLENVSATTGIPYTSLQEAAQTLLQQFGGKAPQKSFFSSVANLLKF